MKINNKITGFFLEELQKENIVSSINEVRLFYDEPRMFQYGCFLNHIPKYTDGFFLNNNLSSSGVSFFSREEALFKCLAEAIERFCLTAYKNKFIIFSQYKRLYKKAINPSLFKENNLSSNIVFGWSKGYNLTENLPCLIPSQLLYLNYKRRTGEPNLTYRISTGAAGGFDKASALLRGIYEVVERDAFMTMYLNKISPPLIDIDSVKNKVVQNLLEYFRRYNLEWKAFDITNDLGITSYMSMLIDKTGIGPVVSFGLKSGTNIKKLLIDSVSEALMVRIFVRNEMAKRKNIDTNPKHLRSMLDRGIYWSPVSILSKLAFILKQKDRIVMVPKRHVVGNELRSVVKLLEKKKHTVYYTDFSLPFMNKLHYKAYKVIIPTLQPLYLDESKKEFRLERLMSVAKHFGQKFYKINPVPHPFL